MCKGASALYTVDCDMDELWNLYWMIVGVRK